MFVGGEKREQRDGDDEGFKGGLPASLMVMGGFSHFLSRMGGVFALFGDLSYCARRLLLLWGYLRVLRGLLTWVLRARHHRVGFGRTDGRA